MDYGMQFTDNDNTVVLDSEFSRLVVLHRGDYSGPINFPTHNLSGTATCIHSSKQFFYT